MSTGEPAADQHSKVIVREGYCCAGAVPAITTARPATASRNACFTRSFTSSPPGKRLGSGLRRVEAVLGNLGVVQRDAEAGPARQRQAARVQIQLARHDVVGGLE